MEKKQIMEDQSSFF